ncbi:DUF998 domain-containing protein [Nocardia alni]|uniref:DUF998 domain-containing protein n=1 Tax=Nocardia alni TaxID=2815723 RepID=UPI001C21C563|nr:DUF998 domain-containing protein [Nocardia alni]
MTDSDLTATITTGVPWWVTVSAMLTPATVLAVDMAGRVLQPTSYDPLTQTLSVLAGNGRTAGIVTVGFFVTAMCCIVTAWGLRMLPIASRALLTAVGCCGLLVACAPQRNHSQNSVHLCAVVLGAVLLALWPLSTIPAYRFSLRVCSAPMAVTVSAVFMLLLVWTGYEAVDGGLLGLAERVTIVAEMFWPVPVVFGLRRAVRSAEPGLDEVG